MIFKLKESNGQTQIFHTIDNDGIFSEFVPLHSFYNRASEDPRFQGLQESLVKIDILTDGMNELSPSYRSPRSPKGVRPPPVINNVTDDEIEEES